MEMPALPFEDRENLAFTNVLLQAFRKPRKTRPIKHPKRYVDRRAGCVRRAQSFHITPRGRTTLQKKTLLTLFRSYHRGNAE